MEDDYCEEVERCSSDPLGEYVLRGLHGGLNAPPELRRCHSLSQLQLLENAVFEMEDRCVGRAPRVGAASVQSCVCGGGCRRTAPGCTAPCFLPVAAAPAAEQHVPFCWSVSVTAACPGPWRKPRSSLPRRVAAAVQRA